MHVIVSTVLFVLPLMSHTALIQLVKQVILARTAVEAHRVKTIPTVEEQSYGADNAR